MNNGGQCCVASKRIIVVDEIAHEFFEKFKVALSQAQGRRSVRRGHDATADVESGCRRRAERKRSRAAVRGRRDTALSRCGEPVPAKGAFVQPTILTDLAPDNPAYYQEFFGPVALFFRVRS